MTLQNGLVCGDKAYLWCDTAYFDYSTGELLGFASKALQGLNWPFAGVLSSIGGDQHEIARDIGEAYPQDVPSLLSAASEALRRYAAKGFMARVLLATWEDRPKLWLVATDACTREGPFMPCEAVHYLSAGNDLPEYKRAVRKGLTPKRMARVIHAQLKHPVEAAGPPGAAGYRIQYGGNVVEIEISRHGVDSRVLRAVHGKA
ncbi:hypothetical protein [Altererythrobacter sp. Root672]|uniref:hypothetical protein n=1 Tax=Altererythrobacter sp. Root672 TaxID=1736584 RepID=UPI0006F1F8DF|nr:hypothetical protein [Altererythrobacter sp. Root672]KRA84180.1 hypothetical protein ASD76_09365 [Altererythrobacter sp. Root672]